MLYVVVYDLPDNRRRTKLAKVLLAFGDRVQESVFECDLSDAAELARMVKQIERRICVDKGDAVRIYRLCATCVNEALVLGGTSLAQDPELIIV
ncbi:MAG: CRISPR-associated endonuclease Cas2 2 [bacterium ADurb.Bin429]|nr:MAG: CRISPR-associated endonuclease Cas2 2 [bacterium ADurb.Bin429]